MIKSVRLYRLTAPPGGGAMYIELPVNTQPTGTRFTVRDIDGLGPVKANISTEGQALRVGEAIRGISLPARTLTLRLGYNPLYSGGNSTQDHRNNLYQYASVGDPVRFEVYSDDLPTLSIDGIVEEVRPNIFTAEPEVLITIFCKMPYFASIVSQSVPAASNGIVTIDYQGDVETGVSMGVSPGSSSLLILQSRNRSGSTTGRMDITRPSINSSDRYNINSRRGERSIDYTRTGTGAGIYSNLGGIDRLSSWIKAVPGGQNTFITSPVDPTAVVQFTPLYKGF